MTNFLFPLIVFAIFCFGILVGMENGQDALYNRCVEANPTIAVGEIKSFCNERLYIEDSK